MSDKDRIPRSLGGVPLNATPAQLAAAQEAVARCYEEWSATAPPSRERSAAVAEWEWAGLDAGGPDPAVVEAAVRRAVDGVPGAGS